MSKCFFNFDSSERIKVKHSIKEIYSFFCLAREIFFKRSLSFLRKGFNIL